DFGRGDRNDALDKGAIEGAGRSQSIRTVGPDNLWNAACRKVGISGVLALGREGEVEIAARLHSMSLENGPAQLTRRPGVTRRFKHDELIVTQALGDGLHRSRYEVEIGFAVRP